jgi:two-component system, OmpR family, response regulator ResD
MARILIIDDDKDIVEAIEILLKANGYETDSAFSRETGEKKALSDSYDLMILDVMMEEADDGLVLARELRAKNFMKPIIMLTSLGKVTGMSYAATDGVVPVDVFHEKPISPQELIETVKRLLEGRK